MHCKGVFFIFYPSLSLCLPSLLPYNAETLIEAAKESKAPSVCRWIAQVCVVKCSSSKRAMGYSYIVVRIGFWFVNVALIIWTWVCIGCLSCSWCLGIMHMVNGDHWWCFEWVKST